MHKGEAKAEKFRTTLENLIEFRQEKTGRDEIITEVRF